MIPLKLNRCEKEIVRRKFCAYCIKILRGEALNYLDELKNQLEREISFSDLLQKDRNLLCSYDDYEIAEEFTVMERKVFVRAEWLSEALKKLPTKKREIIFMLFFLDMTEKEIAAYLKLLRLLSRQLSSQNRYKVICMLEREALRSPMMDE